MSVSEYYLSLQGEVKLRYDAKTQIIDNIDPYSLSGTELSEMDMVNYLILSHSFYTGQQLKAYKYYEAGFVQNVMAKRMNENSFVVGKVKHSQKIREKPLHVWVVLLPDRAISCGDCTCSHIIPGYVIIVSNF